jgi:hypothetical protein
MRLILVCIVGWFLAFGLPGSGGFTLMVNTVGPAAVGGLLVFVAVVIIGHRTMPKA